MADDRNDDTNTAVALEDRLIQLWQHFASVGGNDKDRMVTAATWLLAFSGAIVGYIVTKGLSSDHYEASVFLAALGLIVSLLAAFVTLMYGGYANSNWAIADTIAIKRKWYDLIPANVLTELIEDEIINDNIFEDDNTLKTKAPITHILKKNKENLKSRRGWLAKRAESFSEPHNPLTGLAPIFKWFFGFASASFALHTGLLIYLWTKCF